MQDKYVGDIGDYGKFGLLRAISTSGLSLAINWYKIGPESEKGNGQNDGKYIQYLDDLQYRVYYADVYDKLKKIVKENSRNIEAIKESKIVKAKFYEDPVPKNKDREAWHNKALKKLGNKDIVFLDPDNGISDNPSQKHVGLQEIKDYYQQNQSIIIYQHLRRGIKKENFIKNILDQLKFINADSIRMVEYSSYASRFYILILHDKHCQQVETALSSIKNKLPKFCDEINV